MSGRRARFLALGATLLLAAGMPAAPAAAATPRTSLTAIWNDVMCVSCHEPLSVAQSPQAISERNYIRTLVAQGETKAQIEQALVSQYGPSVLGRPPAHGFNLLVYVLPPAILVLGIATLVITLPRWRRRTRAAAASPVAAAQPALAAADERRLQDELSRYPG
jgi:cytochrome c-type biogenesis protein CcmH